MLHPPRVFQPKQEAGDEWTGSLPGPARENWEQRAAQQRQEHIPPENGHGPSTGTQEDGEDEEGLLSRKDAEPGKGC